MTKMMIGAAVCALLAVPALARDLTVVSAGGIFQDAQRAVYFDAFKAQTGLPLTEDSWDGGVGALRAKAEAGEANTWDVVQVEGDEQQIGCDEGFLEPIDIAKLGGAKRFLPGTVKDCGIPANVYAVAMAYNGDVFADGPKTWADFWDVKKFPGKRALRQGPKMNLEFALMADGVAKDDVYKVLSTPEGVDRAFKKLDELKPYLVWWTSGNQPMQLLGTGEVAMTTTYHTRVRGANKNEGKNYKLTFDGAMFLVDSWVIMKGSPNLDSAYKLLDVLSQTETQVKWPDQLGGGVGTVEAQAKLDPAVAASLPSSPENMAVELPLDADFWIKNIDALNTRFAIWSGN